MGGLTSFELCAGAGGQALGIEQAGFRHVGLAEINKHACTTLHVNRPTWNVLETDIRDLNVAPFRGVDLLAGGLPCPPFSIAGKQLGTADERNLFPTAIDVIDQVRPAAFMFENVRGFLDAIFDDYRRWIAAKLKKLGYVTGWRLLNASDFGVPQLRPRVVFVGIEQDRWDRFSWPTQEIFTQPPTVGEVLYPLIAAKGWKGAKAWRERANEIAPTIVGGSQKHGGPDLGPTRARRAWATLGVDGLGIADDAPAAEFVGMPRLTVAMVALLQGFPREWHFAGGKTAAYRQVGNAFPPPVARAVSTQIRLCLSARRLVRVSKAD